MTHGFSAPRSAAARHSLHTSACGVDRRLWSRDFYAFQRRAVSEPTARASSYRPKELQISPCGVSARLLRYGCTFELAPTERGAAMRFVFEKSGAAGVFLDLPGTDSEASIDSASGVLTATVRANTGGVPAGFATYYAVRIDAPDAHFEVSELKDRRVAVLRFHAEAGRPIPMRAGTSFISHEQALRNLDSEIGAKPFDQVRSEATAVWEQRTGPRAHPGSNGDAAQNLLFLPLSRVAVSPHLARARRAGQHRPLQRLQRQGGARRHVRRPRLLGSLSRLVSDDDAALSRAARRDSAGLGERLQGRRLVPAVSLSRLSQLHDRQPHRLRLRRCRRQGHQGLRREGGLSQG